jgi:hypothetical protein
VTFGLALLHWYFLLLLLLFLGILAFSRGQAALDLDPTEVLIKCQYMKLLFLEILNKWSIFIKDVEQHVGAFVTFHMKSEESK